MRPGARHRIVVAVVQALALEFEPGIEPAHVVNHETLEQRSGEGAGRPLPSARGKRASEVDDIAGDRPANGVRGRLGARGQIEPPRGEQQLAQVALGRPLVGSGPEQDREIVAIDPPPSHAR